MNLSDIILDATQKTAESRRDPAGGLATMAHATPPAAAGQTPRPEVPPSTGTGSRRLYPGWAQRGPFW